MYPNSYHGDKKFKTGLSQKTESARKRQNFVTSTTASCIAALGPATLDSNAANQLMGYKMAAITNVYMRLSDHQFSS